MGKNLKGKDCGKGICQRKDGLYYARFADKTGKRHEKYFQTLPEARNWIEDSKYADKHEDAFVATDTTVDQWFEFWIENIVGDLAPNTLRNYRERYVHNIQPVIGRMLISNQYALILETGLRTGEMIGLTWDTDSLDNAVKQFQLNGIYI